VTKIELSFPRKKKKNSKALRPKNFGTKTLSFIQVSKQRIMNHFKTIFFLLLTLCIATSTILAQDAPPAPRKDAPAKKAKKQEKESKSKPSKPSKSDSKKKQSDDESEMKQDEKKSESEKNRTSEDRDAENERGPRRFFGSSREQERINKFSKQSEPFVELFEPIVTSVDESTIAVVSGKRQIALGTIVDSNGLILTKASELKGSLGCRLSDGTIKEAKVIGIDPGTDLALLQIEAENLNVAQWSDDPTPVTGRWVVTPKAVQDRDKEFAPTVGVVSVNNRIIPPSRPFIGIRMDDVEDGGGVRIVQIIARSPADFADLWVNDVIKSIDDIEVSNRESLVNTLKQYDINDRITVGIERGNKKMKLRLTLAESDKVSPDNQRSNLQNSMGSILSRRRKDFPMAFQHDSMLSSKTCGGPIIDLSGKIVGINIARAGRVSSLALPAGLVREKLKKLKTGEFAPEVVNKEAIEAISTELLELDAKFSNLPDKKSVLENKYNQEKARMEELNKTMSDLRSRLKIIEKKSKTYGSELKSVRGQIRSIEKNRQRLEADREQLRTGSR
jgi:serine protease Do